MKNFAKCFVFIFYLNCIESAFRCDYKYNLKANGWFKLYEIPETWYDARLRCTLQGAVLASPTTPEIEFAMKEILSNSSLTKDTEMFTGIHATFSSGNYRSIDGTPLSEIPIIWAENEPDNLGNEERCITLNMNGASADRKCEEPRPYICYRSENDEVPTNNCGNFDKEYYYENRTNKCYKFHKIAQKWSRAHFYCSAEGGHLVVINSETEAQIIKELCAKYPPETILGIHKPNLQEVSFIGFQGWGETGDWRTIHGETLTEAGYDSFSSGEPNYSTTGQYCGAVFRTGKLDDMWCEKPVSFICEKDPEDPPICHS